MTGDTMALRSILEKSPDADFLREMIGFAAERLMELEVTAMAGDARGGRGARLGAVAARDVRWNAVGPCTAETTRLSGTGSGTIAHGLARRSEREGLAGSGEGARAEGEARGAQEKTAGPGGPAVDFRPGGRGD